MILVGDKSTFAVEFEIIDSVDDWVFGSFVFWLNGQMVGDDTDKSVDLKGCYRWINNFIDTPQNRFEPDLFDVGKKQAFLCLSSSVIVSAEQDAMFAKEKYENTFERFHIAEIGMSSFDDMNILLIESEAHEHRLLWQKGDEEVKEAILPNGVFNSVLKQAHEKLKFSLKNYSGEV